MKHLTFAKNEKREKTKHKNGCYLSSQVFFHPWRKKTTTIKQSNTQASKQASKQIKQNKTKQTFARSNSTPPYSFTQPRNAAVGTRRGLRRLQSLAVSQPRAHTATVASLYKTTGGQPGDTNTGLAVSRSGPSQLEAAESVGYTQKYIPGIISW